MEEEIFKVYKDTRKNSNGGALWEVSNLGRVRKNGDVYIPFEDTSGYLAFGCHYYVHRAVAELFLSNYENKPTVDHLNRCIHDNRFSNLRWATYQEQSDNKDWETARMKMSASHKGKKFSEEHRAKLRVAHLGRKNSEEINAKIGKYVSNTVWIIHPMTSDIKRIQKEQIPEYLDKGYVRGRKIKK